MIIFQSTIITSNLKPCIQAFLFTIIIIIIGTSLTLMNFIHYNYFVFIPTTCKCTSTCYGKVYKYYISLRLINHRDQWDGNRMMHLRFVTIFLSINQLQILKVYREKYYIFCKLFYYCLA